MMEEQKPAKGKGTKWLDFRALYAKWLVFKTQRPLAIKLTILGGLAGVLFVILVVGGIFGYFMYDYTQHNPKFCATCHTIMIESYETWETSEHAEVSCHTCHPLTPEVVMNYAYRFMMGMPDKVPPREEGKIIVPSSDCMPCHWEKEKEFPNAKNVATSRFHATHYFMGKVECMTCHGDKELHVFSAAPDDCLDCHESRQEKVHTAKGFELNCLNCHTGNTADLMPVREECLSCHTEDEEKAPMKSLACAACHTPHQEEATPSTDDTSCISCHPSIENVGQHTTHLQFFGSDCLQCHQPHSWSITEEWAQEECAKCHEYQAPITFIQSKKE